MNDQNQNSGIKKTLEWNEQQSKLLQNWAEIAGSYRWIHNQAHMLYKKRNIRYMMPLIIMSTVTGTANFAQNTFPLVIRPYIPQIIGAINLIAAILTTVYQFLKISEYMESHRIASINYGKFCRNITVELNLPVKNRSICGNDLVKISRNDIDRLIEQSPSIPNSVLKLYKLNFGDSNIAQPEILHINKVDIYNDQENKLSTTIADAGIKFKKSLFKPVHNLSFNAIKKSKIVSTILGTNKETAPDNIEKWSNVIKELNNKETLPVDIEQPVIIEEANNTIDIVEEENRPIDMELSELKKSKIVTSKKI